MYVRKGRGVKAKTSPADPSGTAEERQRRTGSGNKQHGHHHPDQKETIKSSALATSPLSSLLSPISPSIMERGGHAGRKAKDKNEFRHAPALQVPSLLHAKRPCSLPAAFSKQEEAAWGGGGAPAFVS